MCHAEVNAIVDRAVGSIEDATIFVTLFPCHECAKMIIQSGIKKVVYHKDKESPTYKTSREMLTKAKVELEQFKSQRKNIAISFQ